MSTINLSVDARPDKLDKLVLPESLRNVIIDVCKNNMPKPIVITGITGGGKTTIARFIGASLQCKNKEENSIDPCGTCDTCKDIFEDQGKRDYKEINMVEVRSIDEASVVAEDFAVPPFYDKFKFNILDEFHMLKGGQDSLLKPLESNRLSNSESKVIILTNEVDKLKKTIKGRCLHIKLPSTNVTDIAGNLYKIMTQYNLSFGENLSNEEIVKILICISNLSENSIRQSITNLELVLSSKSTDLKEIEKLIGGISIRSIGKIITDIFSNNSSVVSDIDNYVSQDGLDNLLREFLMYLTGIYKCYCDITPHDNEWVANEILNNYKTISNRDKIKEFVDVVRMSTNYLGYGEYKQKSFFLMDIITFMSSLPTDNKEEVKEDIKPKVVGKRKPYVEPIDTEKPF